MHMNQTRQVRNLTASHFSNNIYGNLEPRFLSDQVRTFKTSRYILKYNGVNLSAYFLFIRLLVNGYRSLYQPTVGDQMD